MIDRALRGRTVLAVFAHPDDESLCCGGTLARLAAEGMQVVVMCASHGERGALTGPALDRALGGVRVLELRAAATICGMTPRAIVT